MVICLYHFALLLISILWLNASGAHAEPPYSMYSTVAATNGIKVIICNSTDSYNILPANAKNEDLYTYCPKISIEPNMKMLQGNQDT